MRVGSIPKARTSASLVETATKCFATASSPSRSTSHWRAARAFVKVSVVVKVFEDTMKRVSAGSRSARAWARSVGSTFETNRNRRSRRR